MSAEEWGVVATVVLGLPVLYFTFRQELRARARDDVEWDVERIEQGVFALRNSGQDTAHKVTVEMWTDQEIERLTVKKVESGDVVRVTLPKRKATGPLPVDGLPPEPYRMGNIEGINLGQHREWMKEMAEEQQVLVKVVWRGRWGEWRTDSQTTG